MESNWRFNVWDVGLWGGETTLFAREVVDPLFAVGQEVDADGNTFVCVYVAPPGEVPSVLFRRAAAPWERFPYGGDVEPD